MVIFGNFSFKITVFLDENLEKMTFVSSQKMLKINRTPAFYIHQYGSYLDGIHMHIKAQYQSLNRCGPNWVGRTARHVNHYYLIHYAAMPQPSAVAPRFKALYSLTLHGGVAFYYHLLGDWHKTIIALLQKLLFEDPLRIR